MSFQFVQGRTNNHLTWCMVDSTDFASRESAMSAATKLKIYGTVEGATGVNFVTSGTGSLTNDIVHVGASANGVYHIALAKADLSDASAAWYDEYIVVISATGAAYETFIVEGVRADTSYLSAAISDVLSAVTQINSRVLLAQSAASDAASGVVVANSRLLLVQSTASDAASAAAQANSRVLLNQSRISDAYSMLSDFYSDFQSRVPKRVATDSQLSDLHSDLRSYLAVMSGVQSDLYSLLSDVQSDFQSRVPKRVATDSQLSDLHSDLRSYLVVMSGIQSDIYSLLVAGPIINASDMSDLRSAIAAVTVTIGASDVSDIASAVLAGLTGLTASDLSDIASVVWAHATGVRVDSRLKLVQSNVSDVQSYLVAMSDVLSDLYSDFQSRVPKAVATQSQLSDLHSDLRSYLTVMSGVQSDIYSLLSDVSSDLGVLSAVDSDVYSALTAVKTKTDGLTFTAAGVVDANVQRLNDVPITGDGSAIPFGV